MLHELKAIDSQTVAAATRPAMKCSLCGAPLASDSFADLVAHGNVCHAVASLTAMDRQADADMTRWRRKGR